MGSSPHTRGAPPTDLEGLERERIIPAYAGSTALFNVPYAEVPDHPRIRGEHDVYDMVTARGRGSSPHTRGARDTVSECERRHRIIPAYAGSTEANSLDGQTMADHPRIRGEHDKHLLTAPCGKGSSPHTRGAHGRLPP